MPNTQTAVETKGRISLTTHIKLKPFSWGVVDLIRKPEPGVFFYPKDGKLQILHHLRVVNEPTDFGQLLADLLSEVEFIKCLTYNSRGNFIEIDYAADYMQGAALITSPDKAAQIITEFDSLIVGSTRAR